LRLINTAGGESTGDLEHTGNTPAKRSWQTKKTLKTKAPGAVRLFVLLRVARPVTAAINLPNASSGPAGGHSAYKSEIRNSEFKTNTKNALSPRPQSRGQGAAVWMPDQARHDNSGALLLPSSICFVLRISRFDVFLLLQRSILNRVIFRLRFS
jgi:hypothetical protein